MIINKSYTLMLSISLVITSGINASDKPATQKTPTQIILEKPYRHQTAIATSSVALFYGIRGLAKAPGILRTPFSLALVTAALAALYKTEKVTQKSSIQTIVEPLYNCAIKQDTKLDAVVDHGYEMGIKQIDNATISVQEIAKECSEKKD
ncbi:MAG: hypothetical protein P4L31_07040 [Candidatus Babeliales bacterium]|nr:hypothetical protein [Candidatus Babeliales bacterium]